ncbi:hypothetical protein BDK51DRAFT_37462 [Blyttiomyces helicus]|uniref:Uncharacterized protein n=1 Tax=Blyttiomyces helicus TaxID=388810 RepID=A0A4P9VU29_9FUNG|nr:hypothetical protein BDK51DRAFT_37462 [Blyttiomyces helicus]|eukprot:RKO83069.1 hypothetical protein BDK51DRAFT_37462 [Blyttiomyces helicus]
MQNPPFAVPLTSFPAPAAPLPNSKMAWTLTETVLEKIEQLRTDRRTRYDKLLATLETRISTQADRSRILFAALQDALMAYEAAREDAACGKELVEEEEGEEIGGRGVGKGTGVEGARKECERLTGEGANVERSLRRLDARRRWLREHFQHDLKNLDTLESRLTSITREFEDSQRSDVANVMARLESAGGGDLEAYEEMREELARRPEGNKRKAEGDEIMGGSAKRVRNAVVALGGVAVAGVGIAAALGFIPGAA